MNYLLDKGIDTGDKIQNIKTKSRKLFNRTNSKQINKANSFINICPPGINWDNTSLYKDIKFCIIPRFLIVEDNVIGRLSITEELRRLKLEYRIDIAVTGREAVYKFKLLLNQGYVNLYILLAICSILFLWILYYQKCRVSKLQK